MKQSKLQLGKRAVARLETKHLAAIQAGHLATPAGRTSGRDCTYINCPGPDTVTISF
ncbi:hypothetical protein ACFSUS_21435 [Spirosoma soli]|uniref:Uncharacterized protein n=1 Tax=Spirosoma soli TaxID=1770529 RepID=A0ABW5M897_9BACT